MEVVIKINKLMYDKKIKHKVVYIPDPLCWTEAPNDFRIFLAQRNRWAGAARDAVSPPVS